MKKINLKKIIEAKKLDVQEVASQLFPMHKYPKLALDRIINGESVLDADQISRFSLYTGIPIAELYEGVGWASAISEKGVHVLTNGEYTARLDTTTWTTSLFHKGSLFHSFMLHKPSISLSSYIELLEQEISKHKY